MLKESVTKPTKLVFEGDLVLKSQEEFRGSQEEFKKSQEKTESALLFLNLS
ncbi:hypothetical protein KKG61_03085 [bacterium]|nr:hypothetical protein [bacterium]MBU1599081.1 hypothetical protein [bacterium]